MKTVLLIDDDETSRSVLAMSLAREGWKVIQAEDGEAGLAKLEEVHPDVVFCDLLMPRMNGFQVCRVIREMPNDLKYSKIIVTTGSGFENDRLNAMDAGADAYLVKPVSLQDLYETLDNVLGKTAAPPKPTPSTGNTAFFRNPSELSRRPRIKFWGVRGSIPTPGPSTVYYGGNTSCVEVRADGELIILDAGTGIRPLGLELAKEFKGKQLSINVLLSHTHWDHIQGFPFFIPAYNSNHKLSILGFEGARRGLESTLSSQMESPYFPIGMHQMPANIAITELKDMKFKIGKLDCRAEWTNHPGICVGYRIDTSVGAVAFIPDNEPYFNVTGMPEAELSAGELAKAQFAQARDQKLIDFVRDAEVLIIDCQYDKEEYRTHVGWGHGCIDAVVNLAIKGGVKKLFLFHHDPSHDDARVTQFVEYARALAREAGASVIIDAAREGLEIVLNPVPATV